MKFEMIAVVISLTITSQSWAGQFDKKKGFFGFTRGCIERWDQNMDGDGFCVTSFIPLAFGDTITAPFQTIKAIVDVMESPSSSAKTSNSESSSRKQNQNSEIPEERKVINKLSLFMLVADDARAYLVDRTPTPLLTSAVAAIRSIQFETGSSEDFTSESAMILNLEAELLKALNRGVDP